MKLEDLESAYQSAWKGNADVPYMICGLGNMRTADFATSFPKDGFDKFLEDTKGYADTALVHMFSDGKYFIEE